MNRLRALLLVAVSWLALDAQAAVPEWSLPDDYLRQRESQTRKWQAAGEIELLRAVMAAMQDLEFVLDDVESSLGLVIGSRFIAGRRVRLVVLVRPLRPGTHSVRACAYLFGAPLKDPVAYQDFFDALGRAAGPGGAGTGP